MTQQWLQAPHDRGKEPRQRGPQRALCWELLLLSLLCTPEQVVDTCEWLVSRYRPLLPQAEGKVKTEFPGKQRRQPERVGNEGFLFSSPISYLLTVCQGDFTIWF